MSELDAVIGGLLRGMKAGTYHNDLDRATVELLGQMRGRLPGVCGAFVLSTVPVSKPMSPVCSRDWNQAALNDPTALQAVAHWLAQYSETVFLPSIDGEATQRLVKWLLGCVRGDRPEGLSICPLKQFFPPDYQDAATLRLVLVTAHSGAFDAGVREEVEYVAWVLAHLRLNREASRLAHRCRTLAAVIDQGTRQILTRGAVSTDVRGQFRDLVSRIQTLLNCDTCQLYLLPRFIAGVDGRSGDERVWLAAQSLANREGLRCARTDLSLVSHLWCHPELKRLNVPDVLYQNDYGRYGLDPMGLTRHFLGTVLRGATDDGLLGVLAARDKYAVAVGDAGQARTADRGFTDEDEEELRLVGEALTPWLKQHAGKLRTASCERQLRTRLEALRAQLTADSCELYVLPPLIEAQRAGGDECLELVCHTRRDWAGEAVYTRGEGITGQVFATGDDIIVEDGLAQWLHLDREAQRAGLRKPGKYRVSQHLMAVKVPAPPLLSDAEALAPIGVLKVRDRLDHDRKSLSPRPFSGEDLHLLHAFAQMISVRIAVGEYADQRRQDEMARHRFLTHAFRHDLVGNLIRPAILQLKHHPELPGDLAWLPAHLQGAADMFDRSWVGASLAADVHRPDPKAECDVARVLGELFATPEHCLAPDPDESHAHLSVRWLAQDVPAGRRVRCGARLIELAALALPLAVYHHADAVPRGSAVVADVALRATPTGVRLTITLPLASTWPPSDVGERLTHIISYPRLLQCPPIPTRVFERALAGHGAQLAGDVAVGATTVSIELRRSPA